MGLKKRVRRGVKDHPETWGGIEVALLRMPWHIGSSERREELNNFFFLQSRHEYLENHKRGASRIGKTPDTRYHWENV
jgi:hypothetical protein